jgi:hypothetical protein
MNLRGHGSVVYKQGLDYRKEFRSEKRQVNGRKGRRREMQVGDGDDIAD